MPTLYKKPPFDAAKDFIPVSVVARSPNVLVTNATVSGNELAGNDSAA